MQCDSLEALAWLTGNWQSEQSERVTTETWRQVSAKSFEGVGSTQVNQQLKSSESLRLVAMSGGVYYLAKVAHNPLPVAFELKTCAHNVAVFENLNHDFPKRIVYSQLSNNKLTIDVSDAADKGFTINFKRVSTSPQEKQ